MDSHLSEEVGYGHVAACVDFLSWSSRDCLRASPVVLHRQHNTAEPEPNGTTHESLSESGEIIKYGRQGPL